MNRISARGCALKERGIVFKAWEIDRDTLQPDLEALDKLMGPRTRLVCVTHASNILGTINPIREIADFVHARGAQICVDGVAYAPHRAIDVQALDVDFYVFSLYKTYGPHLAVMYGRHDHLLELDGLYHYFYGKEKVSAKLEPGNPNYELAWGSAGNRRLSGKARRWQRPTRLSSARSTAIADARGRHRRATAFVAARAQRCPHHRRARLGVCAARADHILHRRRQGARAISSAASIRRRSACATAISTRGA